MDAAVEYGEAEPYVLPSSVHRVLCVCRGRQVKCVCTAIAVLVALAVAEMYAQQ